MHMQYSSSNVCDMYYLTTCMWRRDLPFIYLLARIAFQHVYHACDAIDAIVAAAVYRLRYCDIRYVALRYYYMYTIFILNMLV